MKVVVIGGTGFIGSKVVPAGTATLGHTHFADWLVDNAAAPVR